MRFPVIRFRPRAVCPSIYVSSSVSESNCENSGRKHGIGLAAGDDHVSTWVALAIGWLDELQFGLAPAKL